MPTLSLDQWCGNGSLKLPQTFHKRSCPKDKAKHEGNPTKLFLGPKPLDPSQPKTELRYCKVKKRNSYKLIFRCRHILITQMKETHRIYQRMDNSQAIYKVIQWWIKMIRHELLVN